MREIYLVTHPSRADAAQSAAEFERVLAHHGIGVRRSGPVEGTEMVVVLGGDGTILSAAELTRGTDIPILGINYGHVGFLAEAEPDSMASVVEQIAHRQWTLEARMVADVEVSQGDRIERSWVLNEVALEKSIEPMVSVSLGVDGRPVSSFACDAVLVSTPTGSTAYAFSAGGPVIWPDVEALQLIPVAAHALFTRPLVVGPNSELEVVLQSEAAVLNLDGRRQIDVERGAVLTVRKSADPVYLARLNDTPFSGRLVAKFNLPVRGWRDAGRDR